jgi:flagellar assembly factor FliW
MRVETKPYGGMDVDERQKIFFPYGILGFEQLKHYVLLDAKQPPFYWLQSLDRVDVAFALIDPRVFRRDYVLEVPPEDLVEIGLAAAGDAVDFAIVTIPADSRQMTANLQGPVVVNRATRVGRQCISLNPKWKVRHVILEELAAVER